MNDVAFRSIVLDFDGAISPTDVTEALLREFGDPSWWDLELAMRERAITLREALERQAATLRGDPDDWVRFALSLPPLEPSFEPFTRWASERGMTLAIASDGLGFYIEPLLRAAGIHGVAIHTNAFDLRAGRLSFPHAHAVCVGCGTCKMNVVLSYKERVGPTVFVGEGYSDRFGALYADATFAKHHLAEICEATGIPFEPWSDYDDVRASLEEMMSNDEPRTPPPTRRCPGWTEHDGS